MTCRPAWWTGWCRRAAVPHLRGNTRAEPHPMSMTTAPEQSPLGKASAYTDHYDPRCCSRSPRADKPAPRSAWGPPPFFGADLWTAYELGWLNLRGKPQVALAHLTVPCETPNIIESKSFKLYLGSFTNTALPTSTRCRPTCARPQRGDVARRTPCSPAWG
jgi:NADPH-dependent 7-cyano-7-deazaguanine reductase QueF-like protein